jgi:hypothetical protein
MRHMSLHANEAKILKNKCLLLHTINLIWCKPRHALSIAIAQSMRMTLGKNMYNISRYQLQLKRFSVKFFYFLIVILTANRRILCAHMS